MESRSQKSTIDTVKIIIDRVQVTWLEERLADTLPMDLKRAFDHISIICLLRIMESMGTEGDLMRYTELFMLDRNISLVIYNHQFTEAVVKTIVPRGSPISHILFSIYHS